MVLRSETNVFLSSVVAAECYYMTYICIDISSEEEMGDLEGLISFYIKMLADSVCESSTPLCTWRPSAEGFACRGEQLPAKTFV